MPDDAHRTPADPEDAGRPAQEEDDPWAPVKRRPSLDKPPSEAAQVTREEPIKRTLEYGPDEQPTMVNTPGAGGAFPPGTAFPTGTASPPEGSVPAGTASPREAAFDAGTACPPGSGPPPVGGWSAPGGPAVRPIPPPPVAPPEPGPGPVAGPGPYGFPGYGGFMAPSAPPGGGRGFAGPVGPSTPPVASVPGRPGHPGLPGYSTYPGAGYAGHPGYPGYPGAGGHPGNGYGWPGMAVLAQNGPGTAALVLGILSICLFFLYGIVPLVLGTLAVIFGVKGRRHAERGEATNPGQAQAGLVTGIIGIVVGLLVVLMIAGARSRAGADASSTTCDTAVRVHSAVPRIVGVVSAC